MKQTENGVSVESLPSTLGELKKAGYAYQPVKEELRKNLISALRSGKKVFTGIHGYEHSVIPELERAILSKHNILLLGLRGQAKTRLARLMTNLLDEYVPVIRGSELPDDPFAPVSRYGRDLVEELGDDTPVFWLHRSERYFEKLATPDVTVSDLIGDVDPIKAASLKLPYSDERVLHYGMIPRANRCIFVLNELPDLQARLQVALFNILQEGDVQIRGFKMRLPLDLQFVFTANPEDYTNRGSIVTPLKDRIGSQILTHYPESLETAKQITAQEARHHRDLESRIHIPEIARDLVEQIAFEARDSEWVDGRSGVSARMTITAWENILSAAERRMLLNDQKTTKLRLSDFLAAIPAITGKVELVYEGEQEGPAAVAEALIGSAIKTLHPQHFPALAKLKNSAPDNPYLGIMNWFSTGNTVELEFDAPDDEFANRLQEVLPLVDLVTNQAAKFKWDKADLDFWMEWVLWAMAEHAKLSKEGLETGWTFSDLFSSYLREEDEEDED